MERTPFVDTTHADVSGSSVPDGASRRRFLGAGLAGAAIAALAARPTSAMPDDTEPAATTTTPPTRPTEADTELLVFAQQVELAAAALYEAAIAADRSAIAAGGTPQTVFDDTTRANLDAVRLHHTAYAQSISALVGSVATNQPDPALYDELLGDFQQRNASAVLIAAHDLENTLVATHTELIGQLEGTNAAALVASIQIVEARHAAVLASMAGLSPVTDTDAFVETPPTAEPLSPSASA